MKGPIMTDSKRGTISGLTETAKSNLYHSIIFQNNVDFNLMAFRAVPESSPRPGQPKLSFESNNNAQIVVGEQDEWGEHGDNVTDPKSVYGSVPDSHRDTGQSNLVLVHCSIAGCNWTVSAKIAFILDFFSSDWTTNVGFGYAESLHLKHEKCYYFNIQNFFENTNRWGKSDSRLFFGVSQF